MTWRELLEQKRVIEEPTSRAELDGLLSLVRRNMTDAAITELSDDGRFDHAYGAARTLASLVIRSEGYRVTPAGGGHYNTFLALKVADFTAFSAYAIYFNMCRSKRNELSYDGIEIVSLAEVEELIQEVRKFEVAVHAWLAANHPELQ